MQLSKIELFSWSALFGLFLWFVAPGVHWLDATEISLSSFTLGISHPPGQVTQMMLAKAFQWIPMGHIAFRSNLFSAFCSLATALVVASTLKGKPFALVFWAIAFTLFSPMVFAQGVRTEVYALSVLLSVASIQLSNCEDVRLHFMAYFVWGLCFLNHPIIALMPMPLVIRRSRRGLIFTSLACLVLMYLPLRGLQQDVWNFGGPTTFDRLIWFLKGELYPAYRATSTSLVISHVKQLLWALIDQASVIPLFLSCTGALLLYGRNRRAFLLYSFGAFVLVLMLVRQNNFWPNNPDAHGYMALIVWGMCGLSVQALDFLRQSKIRWANVFVLTLFVIWSVYAVVRAQDAKKYFSDMLAQRHMQYLMHEPPPSAKVATSNFVTYSFMSYASMVENRRPDLDILYRGDGTNASKLKEKDPFFFFELGIDRSPSGKYTLRKDDLFMLTNGAACEAWFCSEMKISKDSKEIYETYKRSVHEDILTRQDFATEPFLLHYLLDTLQAKAKKLVEAENSAKNDILFLFPGFDEYNELENNL